MLRKVQSFTFSYVLHEIFVLTYPIERTRNAGFFQVQASDTLNSVAARFDITPSELRKLNRLASNLIFPGQLIHVPEKKVSGEGMYSSRFWKFLEI